MDSSESSSALIRQLEAEIAALKASAETDRLNQEQLVHQIESQFREKEAEVAALQIKLQTASDEDRKQASQIVALRSEIDELRLAARGQRDHLQELESVDRDRAKILKLNESLQADLDRLSKESSEFHKKMLEMNSERAMMQSQYFSSQTRVSSLEFEVRESAQEKSRLEKRVAWLTSELESKDQELREQIKSRAAQLQDLEAKWTAAKEEARGLHASITDLRSRLDSAEQRAGAFSEEARQLRSEKALQLETSRQEVAAQSRLAELHQKSADEERVLVTQLQRTVEIAHEKLAAEEVKSAEASSALSAALTECSGLRVRLSQMEAELSEARAEAERLSHASSGGDALGPSEDHLRELCSLTETDIQRMGAAERYSRFVDMAAALRALQSANRNLQSYLTQIQRELEFNQPLVEQQRTEYQGLLSSHQRVSQRLELANRQLEAARLENSSLAADNKELRGRISALEHESNAAARQVHHLLKQLPGRVQFDRTTPATAGGRPALSLERLAEARGNLAKELVADHLTVFSSVEELADQHQKLRGALLAMIDQLDELKTHKGRPFKAHSGKEEAEDGDDNNDEPMLAREHQASTKQIQELREAREKQEQRVALLTQQLDLLRRAVKDSSALTPVDSVHSEAKEKSAETLLGDLRAEFERYRADKTKYESQLKDELNQSQRLCSELRMKVAGLESEVSILKDSGARAAASNTQLQRESEMLRQQLAHFSSITLKLQESSQHTSSELALARDQLRRCSEQLTAAAVDREQAIASQKTAQQQLTELREDKIALQACVERLQRLQASLEETHSQALSQERTQREELQREWQLARDALDKERSAQRDLMAAHHATTGELHRKVEAAERDAQTARNELALVKGSLHTQTARVEELTSANQRTQAQLDAVLTKRVARADLSESKFSALGGEQRAESELAAAQRECQELAQQLLEAQNQLADFKRLATQQEHDLKNLQDAANVYRDKMERSFAASEAARGELQKRMDELSERSRVSDAESSRVISQLESRVLTLEAEQRALREGRNELEQQLREARDRALSAVEAASAEAARANQFQEHYRRELSMHGKTAEALTAVQAQLQEHARSAAAANSQVASEHQEVKSRLRSLEAEKADLDQRLSQAQNRLAETTQQNTLLMAQLDSLAIQLRATGGSGRSSISDPAAEVAKALELVKHVRHEKELLEAQLEVAKQEASRAAQRLAHTERSLEQARVQLELEMSRRPESSTRPAASEPAVLRESNELLRQECERYARRVNELEQQVTQAQLQLDPLNAQIRKLTYENEALEASGRTAKEEAQRWRDRSELLLDKYKQVDPEAHRSALLKCEQLEAERVRLEERCSRIPGLETRLAQLSGELEEAKSKLQLATQANTRLRSAQTKSTAAEHKRLTDELAAATADLAAARTELEQLRQAAESKGAQAQAEGVKMGQQLADRRTGRAIHLVRISGDAIREQREKLQSLQTQLEQSQRTVLEQQAHISALQTELSALRQQLDDSLRRSAEFTQQSGHHAQALAELQQRAQHSEQAIKETESRHLVELKAERDRADSAQASVSELQAELKRAQIQLSAAQDASSAKESELARVQEEIAKLREQQFAEPAAPPATELGLGVGTGDQPPSKRTRTTPSPAPVAEPLPAVYAQGAFVPLRPPTPTSVAPDPEQLPRFGTNIVLTAPSATARPTSPIVSAAEFWPTPSIPLAPLVPVPEEFVSEAEVDGGLGANDESDSAPRALKRKRGSDDLTPATSEEPSAEVELEPSAEAEPEDTPAPETHLEPASPRTPPDTTEATQEPEDESNEQDADNQPGEPSESEPLHADQDYSDDPESGAGGAGAGQDPADEDGPADVEADMPVDMDSDPTGGDDDEHTTETAPSTEQPADSPSVAEPAAAADQPSDPTTPSADVQHAEHDQTDDPNDMTQLEPTPGPAEEEPEHHNE